MTTERNGRGLESLMVQLRRILRLTPYVSRFTLYVLRFTEYGLRTPHTVPFYLIQQKTQTIGCGYRATTLIFARAKWSAPVSTMGSRLPLAAWYSPTSRSYSPGASVPGNSIE